MTDGNNGMYYAVFLPSLMVIGMGILPFIVMFVFFEKPTFKTLITCKVIF